MVTSCDRRHRQPDGDNRLESRERGPRISGISGRGQCRASFGRLDYGVVMRSALFLARAPLRRLRRHTSGAFREAARSTTNGAGSVGTEVSSTREDAAERGSRTGRETAAQGRPASRCDHQIQACGETHTLPYNPGIGLRVSLPASETGINSPLAAEGCDATGMLPFGGVTTPVYGAVPLGRMCVLKVRPEGHDGAKRYRGGPRHADQLHLSAQVAAPVHPGQHADAMRKEERVTDPAFPKRSELAGGSLLWPLVGGMLKLVHDSCLFVAKPYPEKSCEINGSGMFSSANIPLPLTPWLEHT